MKPDATRHPAGMGTVQAVRWAMSRAYQELLLGPASTLWSRLALWSWGASAGGDLRVYGRPRLHVRGRLAIGSSVRLISGAANYVGAGRRLAIWVGPGAELHIGDGCGISNSTFVCLHRIEVLAGTFIGGGCGIYDTDFHPLDPDDRLAGRGPVPAAPVRIGPRAFVGGHCIVLKGSTIGEGAVVGAGSVVTGRVPDFEVWAGVPARFLRRLDRSAPPPAEAPAEARP